MLEQEKQRRGRNPTRVGFLFAVGELAITFCRMADHGTLRGAGPTYVAQARATYETIIRNPYHVVFGPEENKKLDGLLAELASWLLRRGERL